ncbi:uncharacterized protein Dvar_21200 [Desulfosarcina variabilis str. Montpellier]|uniref:DUF4340 domain-containing protein n=1 Tax=Desulfosarcina variabilis TaxID=2300 RepID=UPI003AFB4CC3
MKGKTFLILLVAAGVLVALAFLRFSDDRHTGDTNMGKKLFSDLPVNQVASITIADTTSSVTLIKGDKTWQVKERSDYPADFGELRDTVVKLSRLKIGRSFTGTDESLTRLSLLAPSAAEEKGRGTQMILKDSSGAVLADVILGQTRQSDGGGSGGQYLKKSDDDTVYLVDGSFRFLKTAPADWLQDEILNIKADAIASVTCYADDAAEPVYSLSRPEKGQKPQMTPIPPDRNVDSTKIDQVFDAMAPLTLDDVVSADEHPQTGDTGSRRLVYQLYDGRQITLLPESDDKDHYWLRVTAETVAVETTDTDAPATSETSENADSDKAPEADAVEDKAAEDKKEADAPVVKTAEQIDADVRPWVFSVKKWQFDSFITQPDGLLEAVEKEGEQASK